MNRDQAREEVIHACLALITARYWAIIHPEDAHSGDHVDLHNDMLDEALQLYTSSPVERNGG